MVPKPFAAAKPAVSHEHAQSRVPAWDDESRVSFNAGGPRRLPGSNEELGFATVAEAAIYLHVSKAMVHKLVAQGRIPASRFGRAVRISWVWLKREAAL